MPSIERERSYVTDILSRLAGELAAMSNPGARMPNGRPMGVGEWRAWAERWWLPLNTVQRLLAAPASPIPVGGVGLRVTMTCADCGASAPDGECPTHGACEVEIAVDLAGLRELLTSDEAVDVLAWRIQERVEIDEGYLDDEETLGVAKQLAREDLEAVAACLSSSEGTGS